MTESSATIVVPGSTANLGPAFDALSVAVALYLRARVVGSPPGIGTLETRFGDRPPTGQDRITAAFNLAAERVGKPLCGLVVEVSSEIPMAAGLGSSAAATIAGLRLYEIARGRRLGTETMLGLATELEGHPDNAAAALLGGIALSCQSDDGRVIARSWQWPGEIRFVVATPRRTLETAHARGVLPQQIPLRDAVANLQRALLLVRAIESRNYGDVREALRDRWHQPARMALVPALEESLALQHPSILGVCLSGAGPSVVALAAPGRSQEAAALLGSVYARLDVPHTIRDLEAHPAASERQPMTAA